MIVFDWISDKHDLNCNKYNIKEKQQITDREVQFNCQNGFRLGCQLTHRNTHTIEDDFKSASNNNELRPSALSTLWFWNQI